jgi:hypothetical protein
MMVALLPMLLLLGGLLEVVTSSGQHIPLLAPPSLPLPRRALLQQQDAPPAAPLVPSGGRGDAVVVAARSSPAVVAPDAAKTPSDCVPPNTVVLVWANRHHRPLFRAQIRNVQHRDCFMSRFVFVALDGSMYKHCMELAKNGIRIRCARSTTTAGSTAADEEEDDRALSPDALAAHRSSRWKDVSHIISQGVNVWAFDVDVSILEVPPFAEAMAVDGGGCDVLYQRRAPETPQMLTAASGSVDHVVDGKADIQGGVSGQMFLRANDKVGREDFTTITFVAKKRHHKYSLLTAAPVRKS